MVGMRAMGAVVLAGLFAALLGAGARAASEDAVSAEPVCAAPAGLDRFERPLPRTARRLATGAPLTIVAVGSSSTFGAGASSPDHSYPSRLAVELKRLWRTDRVSVVNRGVNGETAAEMVARFGTTVLSERPDLVIWQVGSNSVLRDQPLELAGAMVRKGLVQLKASGADVVLMDPQYAPKVILKPDGWRMVKLLDAVARDGAAALFHRFAVMRHWFLDRNMPFDSFLSPDELHMNDWSYGCIARLLAGAIADAAAPRPALVAGTASPRR